MRHSLSRPSDRIIDNPPKTFFIADTYEEYKRLKLLIERLPVRVQIRHAEDLVPEFRTFPQTANSYGTVAEEKISALSRIWEVLSDKSKKARLESLNVHQRDAYIVAGSAGYYFMDPTLSQAGFIAGLNPTLRSRLISQGNIPGIFFKDVEKELGGIVSFFAKVSEFHEAKYDAEEHVSDSIMEIKHVAARCLLGSRNIIHAEERHVRRWVKTPRPKTDVTVENYIIPGISDETIAQMQRLKPNARHRRDILESGPEQAAFKSLFEQLGLAIKKPSPLKPVKKTAVEVLNLPPAELTEQFGP